MKIIRLATACVFLAVFMASCSNEKASVEVNIRNFGSDTILISLTSYDQEQTYLFDTIISKNGKFYFDTLIHKLHHGFIISNGMYRKLNNGQPYLIRSKSIEFFISPNKKITLEGECKEYVTDYTVFGGNLNNQLNEFRELVSKDYAKIIELDFKIENHFINNSPDSLIDRLSRIQRELYIKKLNAEKSFIKKYPDYEFSAYLLNKQRKDTIIKYYPYLTVDALESDYGKLIKQKIQVWESLKVGCIAPDFKLLTLENDTFSLSNQKGKIIILDFWGSWCGSCIKGIPRMKEYYEKYNKDVLFVGIACRDSKRNLMSTVDKYNIPWVQVLNFESKERNLINYYGIEGFPTKIIINREGIIEGIYLGEIDEFYEKMDDILEEEYQVN